MLPRPEDCGDFEVLEALPGDPAHDCRGSVKKEDRGNSQYAWWYLVNTSSQDATVTIRRTWSYKDEIRSDTKQHVLYPGEEREVFSFDRVQQPKVTFLACKLQ